MWSFAGVLILLLSTFNVVALPQIDVHPSNSDVGNNNETEILYLGCQPFYYRYRIGFLGLARAKQLNEGAVELIDAFNDYLEARPGDLLLREEMSRNDMYITVAPKSYKSIGDAESQGSEDWHSKEPAAESVEVQMTTDGNDAVLIKYNEVVRCLDVLAVHLRTEPQMLETGFIIVDTDSRYRTVADGKLELIS